MINKINIGSGRDIKYDWINLDNHDTYGANCVFDLNNIEKGFPIPFENNTFEYVYCSHVLEDFINPIPILDELVRITKINGIIEIKVPYETATWDGIEHKHPFNITSFYTYCSLPDYKNGDKHVKIISKKFYYPRQTLRSWLWSLITVTTNLLLILLFNLLIKIKYDFIDKSILKLFAQGSVYINVKYKKIK
jgi:SAM-dependent methyltransferase